VSEGAAVRSAPAPAVTTPNRWLPAIVFAATLALASVLLFVRVPSTSIELNGTFTGLGFVSAQVQPLNRPMRVVALGVAGATDVQLPEEAASGGATAAFRVAVADSAPASNAGSIVLDRITIPVGTRVWLSRTELPRQYRLSLRPAASARITVHADVAGAVGFASVGAPRSAAALGAPRGVDFTSGAGPLDLELSLAPGATAPRWEQLVVREVRVHRVDDDQDAARPLARPVSTILGGSLFFDALRFGGAEGVFLTVDLRDDAIAAIFQGDVREMRTGSGEHPRTLMPSLLEWLRKRQSLSLLWGSALWLSGVALTLRRWWRKPE
jgi:hypothetical protein